MRAPGVSSLAPMEHVPSTATVIVTAKAHVSAAALGLTGDQLSEALRYAHRIERFKDGLRLWSFRAGAVSGFVSAHEVLSLDGSGRLVQATVTDCFPEADERWRERSAPVPRKRHKSGPHYLRRAS